MYFSLEVLQAKKGDCLLLHFGDNVSASPKTIVIDGGPGGVYRKYLKPRLLELKQEYYPNDPLPLSMIMVSHMDDDHVNGILQLTEDVIEDIDNNYEPKFDLENLWFNTFDDIINNLQIPSISMLPASGSAADIGSISSHFRNMDSHIAAIIASTGQGRKLRDNVEFIGSAVNNPFTANVVGHTNPIRLESNLLEIPWDGLDIKVISPTIKRLEEMQEKWDKDLKKAKREGDDSIIFASLGDRDTSPFNLASIVCHTTYYGKTILLTGDARDDDILQGLEEQDLLDDQGKIYVDILKIPHHGSDRNISLEFFQKVTADHYVFSGDGSHSNPEKKTLELLAQATEGRDEFNLYFTNHSGSHNLRRNIDQFISAVRQNGRTFGCNFLPVNSKSMEIALFDSLIS